MGKVLSEIGPREVEFIQKQKVFFVATAPLDARHTVSVSPKCDGCVVLDPHTVMYGDLTGSGSETAAHVLQNRRMTLLFCNLEQGPPKILRLSGQAQVIMKQDVPQALFRKLPPHITEHVGFRAVYKLDVARVSTSCGYSLPIFDFVKHRTVLDDLSKKMHDDGDTHMFDYQTKKNSFSIDGLPSLALLRTGAPDVVPIEEDGYIVGKKKEEVELMEGEEESDDSSGDNGEARYGKARKFVAAAKDNSVAQLLQQTYRKQSTTGVTIMPSLLAFALLMLVFAVGIAVGIALAQAEENREPTM